MSFGSRAPGTAQAGERRRDARRSLRAFGRRLFGGKRRLQFFYRVDSPQSYLLAQALDRFLAAHEFELEVVIVPAPAADFDPEPLLRARHDLRDARAIAPLYGLSFPETNEVPHEARVRMANAVLLKERPPSEQLALAVQLSGALFAGDGERLHALTDAHGSVSGQDVRPRLEAGYQRLREQGHYEDASLAFEGEWYVGIDRLYHLEERVRAEGDGGPALFVGPAVPDPVFGAERVPVETYFSFGSPYSYVGLARLARLREAHSIEVVPRPVLPFVMRGVTVPDDKLRYTAFDAAREAVRHGVTLGRVREPSSDGVSRCIALAHAASREGKGFELALSAMRAIWADGLDVGNETVLCAVAERAGLPAALAKAARADARHRAWVDEHLEALGELGLWGVPSFRVGERAFFGQDRIPLVLAEAQRASARRVGA